MWVVISSFIGELNIFWIVGFGFFICRRGFVICGWLKENNV